MNVTSVREKIASGELGREIEPNGDKARKTAAEILTAAGEAHQQEAMRYLLNALRSNPTDDQDLVDLLLAWQHEIVQRLQLPHGTDTLDSSRSRNDFAAQHGSK